MYIDTDIIYAFIKPADRHILFARRIAGIPDEEKYTSVVTLVELEFILSREFLSDSHQNVEESVRSLFPRMKVLSLSRALFSESLSLRQKMKIGILDSIHAATALSQDKRIASTDRIFDKIPGLKRIGPENPI